MNKNWLYFISILSVAIIFIIGCSNSNSSDYITIDEPQEIITPSQRVNADGSVVVKTASGLVFDAKKNTFDSEVEIKIKEKIVEEPLSDYFSTASKLYTVTAEKNSSEPLGGKITVTNVEKPVFITIPNTINEKGIYYVGFRKDQNNDWNYALINDDNSDNKPLVVSSRFAIDNNKSEFVIKTYDVSLQFVLFIELETKILNKAVIKDFASWVEPSKIKTADNHYAENLKVSLNIFGDNVSSMKLTDCTADVIFFNNDNSEYDNKTLPIIGASAKHSVSSNKSGAGNKYIHTISLSNFSEFSGDKLSFEIGLNNVEKSLFPATFSVRLNVADSADVLAYTGTKGLLIVEAEKPETRYIHAMLRKPAENAFIASSARTLEIQMPEAIIWTADCERLVKVISSNINEDSVKYNYSYADSLLTIERQSDFAANGSYSVEIAEGIKAVADYTELASATFNFSVMPDIEPEVTYIKIASIIPADKAENVATDTSVIISFDGDLSWSKESESKVTLKTGSDAVVCDYAYADRKLTLTHKGLDCNRLYIVDIAEGLVPVASNTVVASGSFCFMTVTKQETKLINVSATMPNNGEIDVATDSSAVISITFEQEVAEDTDWSKFVTMKSGSDVASITFKYSDKVLTILHDALAEDTMYTVTVNSGIKGKEANSETAAKEFVFRTVAAKTVTVTPEIKLDETRTIDGKYWLASGMEFSIDFKKPIADAANALANISIKTGSEDSLNFTADGFVDGSQVATVTVTSDLAADKLYTVTVEEFTDSDGSQIRTVYTSFATLPDIDVLSVSIASGAQNVVPLEGSVVVCFSKAVTENAIRLVNAEGVEVTEGVTYEATEGSCSLTYSNLEAIASYGVFIAYTDSVTGQKVPTQTITFSTLSLDEPFLVNPDEPNSKENPYLIYTVKALDKVRNNLLGFYKQMADIDFEGYVSGSCSESEGWLPIGDDSNIFAGSYDGNDKKISNLKINRLLTYYVGMFGVSSGYLGNVNIIDADVKGMDTVGCLAGMMNGGIVENCSISGTTNIHGGTYTGGLIGLTEDVLMTSCKAVGEISAYSDTMFGGLVGEFKDSIIKTSYVKGNLTGTCGVYGGGLLGWLDLGNSKISQCYADCNASLDGCQMFGMLIGYANNWSDCIFVTDCYSKGLSNISYSGGIIGYGESGIIIEKCYSTVTFGDGTMECGGIAYGLDSGIIRSCFSTNTSVDISTSGYYASDSYSSASGYLEETKPAGFIPFDTEYWKDTDTATPKLNNILDEVQ